MARKSTVAPVEQQPPIACAYATCERPAMVRRKMPTGWMNLCWHHDDFIHLDGVKKRLAEKGLEKADDETREQWHARLMAYIKTCKVGKTIPRQREPGEDSAEDIGEAA